MTPISLNNNEQRGRFIPWMIAAFFVAFISLLSWFTMIAFEHKPSEVTSNAYQKGLVYNQTLAKADQQKALGWKGEITTENKVLRFRLKDAAGKPMAGAIVKAWLVRPLEQKMDSQMDLSAAGDGIYEAPLTLPAQGVWEVHVTAAHGDQQFQVVKHITF